MTDFERTKLSKLIGLMLLLAIPNMAWLQFPPAAGQVGTTAIHKDSSIIVNWAESVTAFHRGPIDISAGWITLADFGDISNALGYAEGNSTDVFSLGDSGSITLQFEYPIMNGTGPDFAVFENSFSDDYLEFAFVEVSSDGQRFVRFPAISLIPFSSQTPGFGNSDPEYVHNLAGKYRQGYGTPFDLTDISDSSGIDLDSVLFVRIVDVIGSVDPQFASQDSQGNSINDPWPTAFASCGFDLDGIAVINENNIYASTTEYHKEVAIYPNPSKGNLVVKTDGGFTSLRVWNASGHLVFEKREGMNDQVDLSFLEPGIYFIQIDDSSIVRWSLVN